MRDEWDEAFNAGSNDISEKLNKINFNCDLILSLKKIFFSTGINKYVEDYLLLHLFICPKC